jgi:microcystin-dependent protein
VSTDVTTVAGISSNVTSVAGNETNINTCASNIAAILDAPNQATNAKKYAIGLPTEPSEGSAKHWAELAMTETQLKPGMIIPFAGNVVPTGWLLCDGSAISRTTYANLFAIIGTTYGAGDGSTTFNIPNMIYRQIDATIPCKGNGTTLGMTDGENLFGMAELVAPGASTARMFGPNASSYGSSVGTSASSTSDGINKVSVGITTDSTKSGIVADTSSFATANMIIKY